MTPDELIDALEKDSEVELDDRLYVPFLERLGATSVKIIQGADEYGGGFVFVHEEGPLSLSRLGVCQVRF